MLLDCEQVDVLYTDFTKAFDRLDHDVILTSSRDLGLPANIISSVYSFLTERENRVFYAGYFSDLFFPSSGVPQGSNLGPLLFIIVVNTVASVIKCFLLIFADDMKLYAPIYSHADCLFF